MESFNMQLLEKVGVVAICIGLSYLTVKHICGYLKIEKEPLTVLLTAATGQIGYALAPMIAQGAVLGNDQPVILHLLAREAEAEELKAINMELLDSAFPLLQGVVVTTNVAEACKDVDIAIMLTEFPHKEGMDRKDFIAKNVPLYKAYASALELHASDDCKVVVVGNLANTNALILKDFAPSIQANNITSLTRLDHNRALAQISEKLNVHVSDVKNVVIWGNHSSTQYPDAKHALVATNNGPKQVQDLLANDLHWLNVEFIRAMQQRNTAVMKARKMPSASSTAIAIVNHIHDWIHGTPKGTWVSMGVCSDGSYGIQSGLFYSFPVTCKNGEWSIVQGININELSRRKLDETMQEIAEESEVAYASLTNP